MPETAKEAEHEFARPTNGWSKEATPDLIKKAALVADLLTIKMNNLHPWYQTKTKILADNTSETLYSKRVKHGWILVLTQASIKESTNTPTTAEIAIERGAETIILNRDVPSAADVSVDFGGQAILIEGDRVKWTSYGGTDNDVLKASASGYLLKS